LAVASYVIALAAAVFFFGLSLTPERYLLVLSVPAVVLGCGRRYLLDFGAFAALILAYGELRGLAHLSHPRPYYLPQLRAEEFLFGGHVPSVDLQRWLWSGSNAWYDNALLFIQRIHSIVPTTFAFVLWLKRRSLFYRFAASMLALSFGAALVYWLYPAAPPWAAADRGLLDVTKIGSGHFVSSSVFGGVPSVADLIDPNPYAAVPSLHAGYAFLVLLFCAGLAWRTRWRWPVVTVAAVYPALQSFAAVYTGNHYVVDLLLGYACASIAYFGVRGLWRVWRLPGWKEDAAAPARRPGRAAAGGTAEPDMSGVRARQV
jgi:membrane-associated phospholipid phosphatase